MTDIKPSVIQTGNYAVRTFDEGGVHVHRESIQNYVIFQAAPVVANTPYSWALNSIGADMSPLSLWAYYGASAPSGSLIIRILDALKTFTIWELELQARRIDLGNAAFFEFPPMVVRQSYIGQVEASVNLNQIVIFAKQAHISNIIPPNA